MVQVFLTQLATKWTFKFPPHQTFLHYLQKTEQAKSELKWTKNVNKFRISGSVVRNSPSIGPFTYRPTMIAVSCSSESIGRCLGMSMNSGMNYLKYGAERRHCNQWMEKASACLCSHKGLIFRIFSVNSWTTGQLNKLSDKVIEVWKICFACYFN